MDDAQIEEIRCLLKPPPTCPFSTKYKMPVHFGVAYAMTGGLTLRSSYQWCELETRDAHNRYIGIERGIPTSGSARTATIRWLEAGHPL